MNIVKETKVSIWAESRNFIPDKPSIMDCHGCKTLKTITMEWLFMFDDDSVKTVTAVYASNSYGINSKYELVNKKSFFDRIKQLDLDGFNTSEIEKKCSLFYNLYCDYGWMKGETYRVKNNGCVDVRGSKNIRVFF